MTSWLRAVVVAVLAATPWVATAQPDVVAGRLTSTPSEVVADVTIAPGWHVNAHQPREKFLIGTVLTVTAPSGLTVGAVRYPDGVERTLEFSPDKPLLLYEGAIRLTAPLEGTAPPGSAPLRASLKFQACNDTTCLPPRTIELTASTPVAPGSAIDPSSNAVAGWIDRWGWGLTLGWVALLGMALNLTPCVYPMIGVTVAFFGGRQGTDRPRAIGHALLYALGICATFSLLGVVAALTGSLFGAALQRPEVLGGIALLMVGFALSNFGLYQIRMPSSLMRVAGRAGEGAAGAFFMGLTMGIVGAPCIGPVVAALLLYVGSVQSTSIGFVLFTALGLGLGLPYVGLALVAQELRRLPRGGPWLERMEWLFGFVLLGLALHFATPLLPAPFVRVAWPLLVTTGGLVLGFRGADGRPALRTARRVAGVAVAVLAIGWSARPQDGPTIMWRAFSDEALAEAGKSGRPVLIDFEANWCIPCREMEHTTFRDQSVVEVAQGFTALKADVTEQNDAATALMARYTVAGVPTYLLLDADGRERRRLVGFVPADQFVEAMREASRRG